MAFGQQAGPLTSARQVRELVALLQDAGHNDFRDARSPMGFRPRQAAGKFTCDEATAFIDRLQNVKLDRSAPVVVETVRQSAFEEVMRQMPAAQLAAELKRRGWTVTKPQSR